MSECSEGGFESPNDTEETAPTLKTLKSVESAEVPTLKTLKSFDTAEIPTLKTLKSFDAPESPKSPKEKGLVVEDYEKFKDQVRKSTFALRRIIAYADRINEWAFETVSMNDCKRKDWFCELTFFSGYEF